MSIDSDVATLEARLAACEQDREKLRERLDHHRNSEAADYDYVAARLAACEQEREWAIEREEKAVRSMETAALSLASCEQERDQARRGRDQYGRMATEYRARLAKAEEALRQMTELASVCIEGDPWFAEQARIDADAVFALARAALAGIAETPDQGGTDGNAD